MKNTCSEIKIIEKLHQRRGHDNNNKKLKVEGNKNLNKQVKDRSTNPQKIYKPNHDFLGKNHWLQKVEGRWESVLPPPVAP